MLHRLDGRVDAEVHERLEQVVVVLRSRHVEIFARFLELILFQEEITELGSGKWRQVRVVLDLTLTVGKRIQRLG